MRTQAEFERYLEERGDEIDNRAYQLAVTLCKTNADLDDEAVLPWNMEIIGAINEAVEGILQGHGISTCWPYSQDETPCYLTGSCSTPNCPLKRAQSVQPDADMEGTGNEL